MEVSDITLTYRLKLWYWEYDPKIKSFSGDKPEVPSWWLEFMEITKSMSCSEIIGILRKYANVEVVNNDTGTAFKREIIFHSHDHLTQFILKYC